MSCSSSPPIVCGLLPAGVGGGIKGGAPQERAQGDRWSASSFWLFSSLSLEENTYDEYENELGITAIALYDYQAGKQSSWF